METTGFLTEFATEIFTNLPENITLMDIISWGSILVIENDTFTLN